MSGIEVVSMTVPQPSATAEKAVTTGVAPQGKVEEKKSAAVAEKQKAEITGSSDEPENEDAPEEPGDEPESEGDAKGEDGEKRSQNGVKKRIDKLRGRISDRDREILQLRADLAASKSSGPASEPAQVDKPKAQASADAPNPEDFETVAEYVRAQTKFELSEAKKQDEADKRESDLKSEQTKRVESFQAKVQDFVKSHDDWEETLESVDDIPMSLTVQSVILQSDDNPALMYEMAKNREEYERICRLPAIDAARAIGRIEARLEKQSEVKEEKPEIKKTNAPIPLTPLKASGKAPGKSLASLDYDDYRRERMAAQKRK